ncbi:MAG: methylmalonyl-CoA mutase, partial [Bacteroidetes bacterium]
YVESLTRELVDKAWEHIQEVEELGGMVKAIERGIPKMRIEQAAAKKQARIDSGKERIVGVNIFRTDEEQALEILKVDNLEVLQTQQDKLKRIKASRDENELNHALQIVEEAAGDDSLNILSAAIDAARCRATLGEISDALEKEFGRYHAEPKSITGVYLRESQMEESFQKAQQKADAFAIRVGRRPRILVAKLGQDGHDRGARVIATGFADLGFDVDIGPLFQVPAEAAMQAAENDVHILGISSLAGSHLTLVPETIEELKKLGRGNILVVVGGIVPEQDHQELYDKGVAAIFGPGTQIAKAALDLLEKLEKRAVI